jgi:hypothetical protein
VACGSTHAQPSPAGDAAASEAGSLDAASADSSADASIDAPTDAAVDGAPEAAVDPCGPPTTSWSRCSANPLAKAGAQQSDGRYELSIGDPDVQFDTSDNLWRAWWSTALDISYTGPNSQLGIKYAQSTDGFAWTVQPTLTIESNLGTTDWDTLKLETPSVLILPNNPPDQRYLLFYSGAGITKTISGTSIPWYQIGLAYSSDGTSFARLPAAQSPYATASTPYGNVAGLVLLGRDAFPGMTGVADGSVADPEIVYDGTTLHLFFSSLAVDATDAPLAFGIGHATSTDGIHWTSQSNNPITALNGGKGPSVVSSASGGWEIFFQRDTAAGLAMVPSTFNGQLGIWRATSPDLTTFTVDDTARDLTWDGSLLPEEYGWIAVGDMASVQSGASGATTPLANGEHRYYYPAFSGLSPPAPSWVVPLQEGGSAPSLIVLDMARHD